jgi:hypothetical protein
MVPYSQFLRHQRAQSEGCWWVVWHLMNLYSRASDTLHISWWNLLCLHTWLVNRIHSAKSLHECRIPIMSSIGWWVASFNDLNAFLYRYTSSEQTISTHSEEVRWISYVETTFIDGLSFILHWWYITCNHKIDNIRIPGVWSSDLDEHVIPHQIIDR